MISFYSRVMYLEQHIVVLFNAIIAPWEFILHLVNNHGTNIHKKIQRQPSNFDLTVNQISSKLGNSKINSNTSKGLMKSKTITKLTMKDENKTNKESEIISKVKIVGDAGLKSLIRNK